MRAEVSRGHQRSAEGTKYPLYHSPPIPSRQDLSLKPGAHIFCELGDPPVSTQELASQVCIGNAACYTGGGGLGSEL